MSYQALYRVWRPQTFGDVIGQDAIVQTLKNALERKQTSHAYLFTGPRGTGKTSVAKIFAKALNCLHLENGEPDNTCELCRALNEGRLTDVMEIDAASNNGVEEIRDIRDKVKYAPTEARVKVYIIDEVHMLSTGAFNALLKTLEEPPAHVVFILATTDPQKIPATVISRTQRFDFRRITPQDLVARMQQILDDKGITYDDQALMVIAKAAEGGMRDALSILDQVLSFGQDHVTVENALDVTGGAAVAALGAYLSAIGQKDVAQALQQLNAMLTAGTDAARLVEDLIGYLRDLLIQKSAPQLLDQSQSAAVDEHFQALAEQFSASRLYAMIDVLTNTQQQLRLTNQPSLYCEVATIELVSADQAPAAAVTPAAAPPAPSPLVNRLQEQVASLQAMVQQMGQGAGQVVKPVAQPKRQPKRLNKEQIYPILGQATKTDLNGLKAIWPDLLSMLSVTKRAMMAVSEPVAASPDGVIVSFDYDIFVERAMKDAALMTEMTGGLNQLTGHPWTVVLVQKDDWPKVRATYLEENGAPKPPKVKQTPPVVATIHQLFGDEANINYVED